MSACVVYSPFNKFGTKKTSKKTAIDTTDIGVSLVNGIYQSTNTLNITPSFYNHDDYAFIIHMPIDTDQFMLPHCHAILNAMCSTCSS